MGFLICSSDKGLLPASGESCQAKVVGEPSSPPFQVVEEADNKMCSSEGSDVCIPSTSDSHQSHFSGSRGKHGIPLHRAFKTFVKEFPEKDKTAHFHFVVIISQKRYPQWPSSRALRSRSGQGSALQRRNIQSCLHYLYYTHTLRTT